jgi:CRP/FNR family transcriptional regulator, cyclic AMP receptor protein
MWLVIAAWVASLLVFSTFFMKTMIPLRIVGIASNVAFMSYALVGLAYGVFGRLYPILVLHACLLPLNVFRLRQVRGLVQAVRSASDDDALQALVPYMKTESHPAGEVLFRRGDPADKLYMIQRGRVLFPEIGKDGAAGSVFGEVGLLAAPGTRSLTAVCQDDCQLSTITKEKTLELYYQNPTFGMFLLRLLSGHALDRPVAGGRTSPRAGGRSRGPSGASASSRWSDAEDS